MADEHLAPQASETPTHTPEAKPGDTPTTTQQPKEQLAFWHGLFSLLSTVVETFGWPGTLLILGFVFIVSYATDTQKEAIIDLYVLGKGIGNAWPLIFLSCIFVATVIAQHRLHRKKEEKITIELERVSKEKGVLQEKKMGRTLQHAKSKTKQRR